jgi:threonine dehydratase
MLIYALFKHFAMAHAISIVDVEAAAKRLEGVAHVTPVLTSQTMDALAGRELFFKCEMFQRGESALIVMGRGS